MRIATFNTRTLKDEDRIVELELALEGEKWDIIGLAEIRRNYESAVERKSGNLFFHSAATNGDYGTGFLVNSKIKKLVTDFKGISDRLAIMEIRTNNKIISILQVHAPTSKYPEKVVEDFYEQIKHEIENIEAKHRTLKNFFLIGDFNASVSQKKVGEGNVLGDFNFGKRNQRGELLVNFAGELNNLT